MKKLLLIFFVIFASQNIYSQVCCGGGVYDVAVLSLNKRALFNVGIKFDNYLGVWNDNSEWRKTKQTNYQLSPTFSAAYRFNKYLQAGILVPFVYNENQLSGLPIAGRGFGDVVLSGRFELAHEYTLYQEKNKPKLDNKTPYIAFTFGMTFPTGKSDEKADSEIDITGKGFFTTSFGVSVIKTILKDKLQVGADVSWQHSFNKTYTKYFNQEIAQYERRLGERFNYGLSLNYLINFYNSVSLSASGFTQGNYTKDGSKWPNSNEYAYSLTASYTYYPRNDMRLTPLVKWNMPSDNFGKNAPGSVLYGLNFVYYIENLYFDE